MNRAELRRSEFLAAVRDRIEGISNQWLHDEFVTQQETLFSMSIRYLTAKLAQQVGLNRMDGSSNERIFSL